MFINKSFVTNADALHPRSVYLERTRLNKLLEEAVSFPLVAVYAGSGYGKTRAIYSFLQKHKASNTAWIQLSDRDNSVTRFWENYANTISLNWPDVGARLREIGFPETDEAFSKYSEQRLRTLDDGGKFFLVYDDFHLINNPAVLRFFDMAANSIPHNATTILISRTVPEINITGLMLLERVFTIHEEALCFTESELREYFDLLALSVTRQNIRDIYDDTRGWAFAINLIGRSLSQNKKYERYALVAMKENISNLIESEASSIKGSPLWYFLLRISLIDHLAADLIRMLADDYALIKELNQMNAYIRYDFHQGAYMIHHLFKEYLRRHQRMLSEDERRDTYNKAGQWCENNNYHTDALAYYEKAGNYEAIMWIVYLHNIQASQDMAKYVNEIFERMPKEIADQNPLFPFLNLKIKSGLGLLREASAAAEQFANDYEARPQSPDNNRALAGIYHGWAVLRMILSPYTHEYNFDVYFKKMREFYDRSPFQSYGRNTRQAVGSYALFVGTNRAGAPDEYIQALKRAIPHSAHALNGNLFGMDDLAQGELYFYQKNMDDAERYFSMALDKARSRGQYDTQSRTLQYQMLISFSRGDIEGAKDILKQSHALLDVKDYSNRYESYDIALSHFYICLNQPEKIPDWLKSDFAKCVHPIFMENYVNRIRAQYRYLTRQYNTLLAFLEGVRGSHMILYCKIAYKVLEALSLYHLKRKEEAISALTEAYYMAEPNKIIVPFTQHSKDMRTLTGAALRSEKCTIPRPWLEEVNRKASAFSRRQNHMMAENKAAGKDGDAIVLTNREKVVLEDLAQGLSRTEIAAVQNISVNTVKMVINSIYDKLRVTSLHDALRVAISKKVI